MNSVEWVEKLESLASQNSAYRNAFPYNLLYWDGVRWWADCVNLLKALFNGRDITNKTVASYQHTLSKTGDCDEWGLLNQCTDISQDFDKLKNGEPRVLYKSGHIGTYLGKEAVIDGTIRNVIECTPAWENGIIYSYVDRYGNRSHHKGASATGSWTHHGKATKWVEYVEQKGKYSDVPVSASYYKAVEWASDKGIASGYKDGTFRPDNACTRSQFVTMLWRMDGRPKPTSLSSFSDVNVHMSAYKAIMWAVETGIIVGYKDGTFRPNEPLTRSQAVVMLWRWAGRPTGINADFSDVSSNKSYYKAVAWGNQSEIVKGYSDGTFRPSDNCLRRHTVVFLYRLAKYWGIL